MSQEIIMGVVSNTGERTSGKGFKVSKNQTGVYDILFDEKFRSAPAVVVTGIYGSHYTGDVTSNIYELKEDKATVVIGSASSDKPVDLGFAFIAGI